MRKLVSLLQQKYVKTCGLLSLNHFSSSVANIPHVPVLSSEVAQAINPRPNGVYVDMTFGGGGHTLALLETCPDITVIALDRDSTTLQHANVLVSNYGLNAVKYFNGKFTELLRILQENSIETSNVVDGVIFDVGVSSMQFTDRNRGFALSKVGPLDMRMNRMGREPTAADVVNKLEERDLQHILKKYGQEKYARQVAHQIVEHRQMLGPIKTTKDLRDLIGDVYKRLHVEEPKNKLGGAQHPATLTFQALRIFVNDELNELYNGLKVAHQLLKDGAPCAVVTFHSLEHNIVHQVFNYASIKTKESLITDDLEKNLHLWQSNSVATYPAPAEVEHNPRSRSAQLRVATKKSVFI